MTDSLGIGAAASKPTTLQHKARDAASPLGDCPAPISKLPLASASAVSLDSVQVKHRLLSDVRISILTGIPSPKSLHPRAHPSSIHHLSIFDSSFDLSASDLSRRRLLLPTRRPSTGAFHSSVLSKRPPTLREDSSEKHSSLLVTSQSCPDPPSYQEVEWSRHH